MIKEAITACALSLSHPAAWKSPIVHGPNTIHEVKAPTREPSAREWLNDYRKHQSENPIEELAIEPNTVFQIDWFDRTLYRKKLRTNS